MTRPSAAMPALRRAEALADAATIVARRIPAPRGLPFYGLDHPPGVLDRVLAQLSDLGIFRVYSRVLDLTGGLGGPARWLARRHGCRVTLADADFQVAAAAAFLTARAHLADRVSSVVLPADPLSFAPETFTHAWDVDPRAKLPGATRFAEVWRALRPGGWLALARASGGDAELDPIEDALGATGFEDITRLELASLAEDDSTAAQLVAERLAGTLGIASEIDERARAPRSLVGVRARKPT